MKFVDSGGLKINVDGIEGDIKIEYKSCSSFDTSSAKNQQKSKFSCPFRRVIEKGNRYFTNKASLKRHLKAWFRVSPMYQG